MSILKCCILNGFNLDWVSNRCWFDKALSQSETRFSFDKKERTDIAFAFWGHHANKNTRRWFWDTNRKKVNLFDSTWAIKMYMILYLCIYRLYIKTFGAIRRERTTGNEFLKWGRTKWRENEFLIWLLYCSTQCITSKDTHTHMYLTMWNYMTSEKYTT